MSSIKTPSPKKKISQERQFPVRRLIPNGITILALCLGLTSVRLGLEEHFEWAALAILAAAFLDAVDGRIARLLKAESQIGAQLDSLSDFFNFGVAPVMLIHFWGLQSAGRVGWVALLLFSVCCALRLARFNVDIENPDRPAWMRHFFIGVPSPMAGIIVMLPLYFDFAGLVDLRSATFLTVLIIISVAVLMISRIPSFSGKTFARSIARKYVLPVMLAIGGIAALLFSFPWQGLIILCLIYLALLPVSYHSYKKFSSA